MNKFGPGWLAERNKKRKAEALRNKNKYEEKQRDEGNEVRRLAKQRKLNEDFKKYNQRNIDNYMYYM